jgi:serine/threonine protein kinase
MHSNQDTGEVLETTQRWGDYYLVRSLAKGGMAEIFLAKKTGAAGFEKNVVLKRMLDNLVDSKDLVEMFLDEGRLAAKLNHPNVAHTHDFGIVDGRYFIVMEHIPGEDLRTILKTLRGSPIPLDIWLRVMVDIAAGLEYAHKLSENGRPLHIIHRDVSPSNIMLGYQGVVTLVDFGIAKATSRSTETTSPKIKGKIAFLSPEQIEGQPIDGRSDIFSLGLTMYLAATGKHPFNRDTDVSMMHAIANAPIKNPCEIRPGLPKEIGEMVMRCLERDPNQRYTSAGELRKEAQFLMARMAPAVGNAEVAHFLVELFGQVQRDQSTRIPTLSDMAVLDSFQAEVADEQEPVPKVQRETLITKITGIVVKDKTASGTSTRSLKTIGMVGLGAVGGALILAAGSFMGSAPRDNAPLVSIAAVAPPPPVAAPTSHPQSEPASVAPEPEKAVEPALAAVAPKVTVPAKKTIRRVNLSPQTIASVIQKQQSRLTACFLKESAALTSAAGTVTIELTIAAGGNVTGVSLDMNGINSPALRNCLVQKAKQIHFPAHNDDEVRFRLPLNYERNR